MPHNRKIILAVGVAITMVLLADAAGAMPVFARKYRTSCMTCHEGYPRRNAVGQAFRMNGFRFEDDEIYNKEAPIEMGDEAYKRLWPKSVWPSDIPQYVPLSFSTRFLVETDLDGSRKNPIAFLLPEELELVWAGTMGENIAFYGDIILLQKDFGEGHEESWITLKAWVEFQNLIGHDSHFNLRVGTIGTHSMGLYTARDSNTFTTHFYQYTTWVMPGVNVEQAGLGAFLGNPFSIQPQMGLEFNGHGGSWAYAAGVASGNMKVQGDIPPEEDIVVTGSGKNVNSKDFFGQLAFKIGGLPFDGQDPDQANGQGTETNVLSAKADSWRDDSLTLSAWGYLGKSQIHIWELSGNLFEDRESFWRLGAGALQKYGDMAFGAGYVYGNNENPYGRLTSASVNSQTWFAETLGFAYPWLIPFLRYEGLSLDLPQGVPGVPEEWAIQRFLPGVKALLRANISLTVEVPVYIKGAELEEGFDMSLFILLSMVF